MNAWIQSTTEGMDAKELCEHFEFTLSVLWFRSAMTVSDVRVAAVFERIFLEAREKFPMMKSVTIEGNHINLHPCLKAGKDINVSAFIQAMESILTEFFDIMGNLTGEVLSPHLHKTLLEIKQAEGSTVETISRKKKAKT